MQNQTSTELLLGIYLTNPNEEEEEEEGRAQCQAGGRDHCAPHPPLQGSLSMIHGHIWAFWFLLVVTHSSTFLPWCFHYNRPSI